MSITRTHRATRVTAAALTTAALALTAACSTESTNTQGNTDSNADPAETKATKGEDVLVAFKTAGLPVRKARDNTTNQCPTMGCDEWITTEDVTIIVFTDPAKQAEFTDVFTDAAAVGDTVLSFTAQRTPIPQQKKYTKVLTRL